VAVDRPSFSGRVDHSLDDKGRLVVPARFRERLGADFILTVGLPDPCLALYPAATWNEQLDKIEHAPKKDASYRNFVRFLFAHTDEASCDSQGRLMLPAALRGYASIEKDVVTNGNNVRVEIWSRELFEQHVLPLAAMLAAKRAAQLDADRDVAEEMGFS
jgi:MraZ protein